MTGLTGVLDLLLLVLLHDAAHSPLWLSAGAAYAASGCFNFLAHARLTYRRPATLSSFTTFWSVAVLNLFVTSAAVVVLARTGVPYLAAKGVVMVVLLVVNYLVLGRFVFGRRSSASRPRS